MAQHRLYQLLSHAQHRLHKHANAECRSKLGTSAAQLGVLLTLSGDDGQRLSTLAERLGVNKSAMTKLAERLEGDELVERRGCELDARASELHLTAAGKALVRKGRPLERGLTRELTEGFTDDEIDVVARFLNTLIERTRR